MLRPYNLMKMEFLGLMGSEDQPFYYGAKTRSLFSRFIAQGKNSGKKGIELKVL